MNSLKYWVAAAMMAAAFPAAFADSKIVINPEGPPAWNLPMESALNWKFFEPKWQTRSVDEGAVANFRLSAKTTIGEFDRPALPYDTEGYMRVMLMPQLFYEGGLILRTGDSEPGYRVQFSVEDQSVAICKGSDNFLGVAPCRIEKGVPFAVVIEAVGPRIVVSVSGTKAIEVVDRLSPVLSGQITAGANHATVTFDDIHVQALPASDKLATEAHKTEFTVRPWCGQRWIFDGDEPVARLAEGRDGKAWNWHPVSLTGVKLRPGTRAADYIPLQHRSSGFWPEKPMEIVKETPDEVIIRALTSDRKTDAEPTVLTTCDVHVTYDSDLDTYVYTMDSEMKYLEDQRTIFEIMDPWPYGVAGPGFNAPEPWDTRYQEILWRASDEKIYRHPLNHFVRPVITALSSKDPVICFAGEEDVNPTYEILPPSAGNLYKIGLCTTMLDLHVQRKDLPDSQPAGTIQKDRWRISSSHGRALERLAPVDDWHESFANQAESEVAVFDPRGTHFSDDQVVHALSRSSAQAFSPHFWYTIDRDVGRSPGGALRMEADQRGRTVSVWEGLSYFGTRFSGEPYVLRAAVKTVGLEGKFVVRATLPGNRVESSRVFEGTTDGWQEIEIRCVPRPDDFAVKIGLELDAIPGSTGHVLIDDVSFLPAGK